MIKNSFNKIFKLPGKTHGLILAGGLFMTLLVATLYVFKPSYLNLIELKLYDTILAQSYSPIQANTAVIVDIDDQSLKEFGQWPWPRYRVAQLLESITNAGPLAVGLDILFSEPDRTSPIVLKKALKKDLHVEIQFSDISNSLLDNDKLLADELNKGIYVLGFSGVFSEEDPDKTPTQIPELKTLQIKAPGAMQAHNYLFQASDLIPPLPVLLKGSHYSGFMNTVTDRDGVLRKTPLFISQQQKIYPQLSLATLLAAFKDKLPDPIIKITREGIESITIGDIVVPLTSNGSMLINYRGPRRTFPYISARDVLNNKVDSNALKGKIVFVGTSASGLKDIRVSPLDPVFPGVEAHATIVDNILSNDFIYRPDWAPGLEFILILLWGLITTILIGWSNATLTVPITLLLGIGAWFGGVWSLKHLNIWVSSFFPLIILVINFSVLNMQKFWFSEKKKKFFKSAFSKYVSKSVVNQLVDNPDKLSLEGEEKEISILFSDIRKFTTISEQLTPTQISALLHYYFTSVTKIIINNYGTHDKFIGDAVMSFWNAPIDVDNHERYAIKAALEMNHALTDLNKGFKDKFGIQIAAGIGLHSGRCRVGNMGSDDIFDYTIIGDSVNLASRLESLTKFYGVPLLVSEAMLIGLTNDLFAQEIDLVRVKGKDNPVRIYTVYSTQDAIMVQRKNEIEQYQEGLLLYREQCFEKGEHHFKALSTKHPEQKLYTIYQERCAKLKTNPPDPTGEKWDGVYTHTIK